MAIPSNFMNQMITDQLNNQTREFFRPKSTLERVQLVLSVSWLLLAFLGSLQLQAIIFFLIIIIIIFNRLNLLQEEVRSFLSDIARFSLYFFLFLFLKGPGMVPIKLFGFETDDIILIQTSILAGLIVIGVFVRNIRLQLLKPTMTNMLTNYLDFIFQGFKGAGSAIFLYVLFELLNWLPQTAITSDSFPNIQDILLMIASLSMILASQSPEGPSLRKLMVSELFLTSETKFERLRDALFKISLIILFYINIVPMVSSGHTIVSLTEWNDAATLIFVIAFITFMISLFDQNSGSSNLKGQAQQFFTENSPASKALQEKFNVIRDNIQDASVEPEKTQYFKLNEDLPIVNKAKTKFIAKKNSVAIPVKETPEGVAVVFVGENELIETKQTLDNLPEVQKIDESATAMIIPNDVWQSTYAKFEALKPTDEAIAALELKGIESKEKLVNLAQSALSDLKTLTIPTNITNRVQGMMQDFQRGKYFISETKEGTHIRLPGITVIENNGYTFVRVFGLKVLEGRGSTVVQMPFLKVIDTPTYDFVNLPFLKVIETGGSSLVNIGGFQITEGDQTKIESAIKQISSDAQHLSSAFTQLDTEFENILASPEQLLITRSATGKNLELISGTKSDNALIGGNLLPPLSKKHRGNKKRRKNKKTKKRIKAGINISINSGQSGEGKILSIEKEDVEPEIIHTITPESAIDTENPKLELLEKFDKIIKVSQGSINFNRLARQLHLSIDEVEDWLLSLGLDSLQINWEENKLVLTESVKEDLRIELSAIISKTKA